MRRSVPVALLVALLAMPVATASHNSDWGDGRTFAIHGPSVVLPYYPESYPPDGDPQGAPVLMLNSHCEGGPPLDD